MWRYPPACSRRSLAWSHGVRPAPAPRQGRPRRRDSSLIVSLASSGAADAGSNIARSMLEACACRRAIAASASVTSLPPGAPPRARGRPPCGPSCRALRPARPPSAGSGRARSRCSPRCCRRSRVAVPSSTSTSRSAVSSTMWRSWLIRITAPSIVVERLDQRLARIDVEVVGRLVEDQQVRRVAGDQRQRQPRALAARKLGRPRSSPCGPRSRTGRAAPRTAPGVLPFIARVMCSSGVSSEASSSTWYWVK